MAVSFDGTLIGGGLFARRPDEDGGEAGVNSPAREDGRAAGAPAVLGSAA